MTSLPKPTPQTDPAAPSAGRPVSTPTKVLVGKPLDPALFRQVAGGKSIPVERW